MGRVHGGSKQKKSCQIKTAKNEKTIMK